ncbi:MAG: hypothetical protein E3J86_07420 [Candidatus Thorarchaeota archaeon]|nr:MAG: hypothetical protein E3J86_07420 [Candidatus Thorarchaeota archaeon]
MQKLLQVEPIFYNILSLIVIVITIALALFLCGFCTRSESIPPSLREEIESMTGSRSLPRRGYPDYHRFRTGRPKKKPITGVSKSITVVKRPPGFIEKKVEARRGGEFLGNRMRFKVKVLNQTKFTITDITVFLISYPSEALHIDNADHTARFPKIEPDGFRSPTFDFLPTQDCVKGDIVAGVSYIDHMGNPHTLNTKPFIIRSVCDLLMPEKITAQEFEVKLKELECGELVVKVSEWSPEEMFEKSLRILEDANFYEVSSEKTVSDNTVYASITGFAKGKYTGKQIGVKISISGPTEKAGASCTIQVSGEDQAMILPAIDDLRERLNAWLCPNCSSSLNLDIVEKLKDGKVVICSYCNVSIGR